MAGRAICGGDVDADLVDKSPDRRGIGDAELPGRPCLLLVVRPHGIRLTVPDGISADGDRLLPPRKFNRLAGTGAVEERQRDASRERSPRVARESAAMVDGRVGVRLRVRILNGQHLDLRDVGFSVKRADDRDRVRVEHRVARILRVGRGGELLPRIIVVLPSAQKTELLGVLVGIAGAVVLRSPQRLLEVRGVR